MAVKVSSLIFDRKNGLTICRLFLSLCVTISHSYPLSGYTNEIGQWLTFGQDSLGSFAIKSFMAISGFLILPSFYRNNLKAFSTKRVLRIFPGFLSCIILTAFVFIPFIDYTENHFFSISLNDRIMYILNNIFLECRQFGITSLLDNVPYAYAINGSLWTLYPEFKGYIFIAVAGSLSLLKRYSFTIPGLFILLFLYYSESVRPGSTSIISQILSPIGFDWPDSSTLQLAIYLMTGIILYQLSEIVCISKAGYIFSVLVFLISIKFNVYTYVQPFFLIYFILCFAYYLPSKIKSFEAYGDFSYGVYLYSFPVQQILSVYNVQNYGLAIYNLLTLVIVFPLAFLSWKLVEKPCIDLIQKL